jgi:zinc protease
MTRRSLLAMAAGSAWAAERLHRAPVSRESLTVKLPQAAPVKLANGVTLLAIEDNRLPAAWVRFQIDGAGSIYETRPGLAGITAAMLGEGANGKSGRQIAEAASRWGATFASYTQTLGETATVDGSGLTGRFDDWIALLASVVMRPSFPADEFNTLRQRLEFSLRARALAPQVAEENLLQAVYGSHPAARMPTVEGMSALTPDMVGAWYRERYSPANTVVSCIGRIRPSAFTARAGNLLESWKGPDTKVVLPPPPISPEKRRVVLVDRPGERQTEIGLGGLLFETTDPDFFPVIVLNSVLSAGTGSRVFRVLREEKGYAYNASGSVTLYRFPGMWRIRARVRPDATEASLAILLSELRRMIDEPVTGEELQEAKGAAIGRFARTLEDPNQVIAMSYQRYRYGFSPDYLERYPDRLMAVTASEIQAVAKKYFAPDRAHIVIVGDAKKMGKLGVR